MSEIAKGDQKFRQRLKRKPKKVTLRFQVYGDTDRPTNEVAIRTGKQLKRYKRSWDTKYDTECRCSTETYTIQMSFSAFRRLALFKGTVLIRLGGKHDLRASHDRARARVHGKTR